MTRLITEQKNPPIPDRRFDWIAYEEGSDFCPDSHPLIGHGRTEVEAIADYFNSKEN